jgi:transglutaminase-like putative cysteine protease
VLAKVLAAALALSPFRQDYQMSLSGTPVGRVRLAVIAQAGGFALEYASETAVRSGPVIRRNTASAHVAIGADSSVRRLSAVRHEGGMLSRSVSGKIQGGALRLTVVLPGGKVLSKTTRATALPSSLVPLLLGGEVSRCAPAVEETTGRTGEACASRKGSRVEGTLLGEPFVAELDGDRLARLELPAQEVVFTATSGPLLLLPPPDLFGSGVATVGLPDPYRQASLTFLVRVPSTESFTLPASPSQAVTAVAGGVRVRWRRAEPSSPAPSPEPMPLGGPLDTVAAREVKGARDAFAAARTLTAFVALHVDDKRPAAGERSAEWVYENRRASCVGHTELFLSLARRAGLTVRRALGLVAEDDRFWAHAWAQVEVGGKYYDVDPTEGEAPARAPRVLFGAETEDGDTSTGRKLALTRMMRIEVEPVGGRPATRR